MTDLTRAYAMQLMLVLDAAESDPRPLLDLAAAWGVPVYTTTRDGRPPVLDSYRTTVALARYVLTDAKARTTT